ncbi:4'-phosphopantetheinyl transferase superfamily protein [Cuneatibacter sp. NSJ-177]|jgi:4'-phosphopantetheinyl transferase|uniref:4'-phosphopantetheinyl transferase family protein n=1 Tax=Cuneatibacter sp. NSJ-177 TaxID=2931401 RepID=UPI001FD5E959|nr:4'-phosphopantetheinyl transferase superfamily protein [Cuneatibacter sp. NSJ-177]MCJ7836113.1 4'-phosphopantetheinyl transferase superfamily protein [Cuneatibacter sp. NSJ-177]
MIQTACMDVRWLEEEALLASYSRYVSERCREKLQRLRPLSSRAKTLGAELLLWEVLRRQGKQADREIMEQEGGKPYFPQTPEISFNLSHSGDFVACVVSDHAAGVDIQEVRPQKADVAGRYFTERERNYIAESGQPEQAFIEIWSLRESYMKKTGEGFALPLGEFSIETGDEIRVIRNGIRQPEAFRLWHPIPGYVLTVCGAKDISPQVLHVTEIEVRNKEWNGEN